MTKAQMQLEIARLRMALGEASRDLDVVATLVETEGVNWARGYAEQAALGARNALTFKVRQ